MIVEHAELQTCIYDHVPHVCDHARDDAEYHARRAEPLCAEGPAARHQEGADR